MYNYHKLEAKPNELKTASGSDWILHSTEHISTRAICNICPSPHFLHFYVQEGKITYYYCKNQRKWVNDLDFIY